MGCALSAVLDNKPIKHSGDYLVSWYKVTVNREVMLDHNECHYLYKDFPECTHAIWTGTVTPLALYGIEDTLC